MERQVVKVAAHNIVSPLGYTSEDNLEAVLAGRSCLRPHPGAFGLPETACMSLLDRESIDSLVAAELPSDMSDGQHMFERLCVLSARRALDGCGIDPSADDTVFVLSTTKGNVSLLEVDPDHPDAYLATSAERIARSFGNANTPVVVSNACISGVAAQIAAARLLEAGLYRNAVVIGCDLLSRFIVSGFQSFKALSPEPCRPFDSERSGLNLGEAAATMVLTTRELPGATGWSLAAASIHNDANHISGPSRTGEGSFRVLQDLLRSVDRDSVALVNPHGTATPYNDEMESIALHRAGLDTVPLCGLKGYYGHTLGAAGVVETIISMLAVERGIVPGTRGYGACGTGHALNIDSRSAGVKSPNRTFIKMLSGFGGCNAGIAYTMDAVEPNRPTLPHRNGAAEVTVTPDGAWVDGKKVSDRDITGLYREFVNDYPKFFKMDQLCKLGFVAAELLLRRLAPEVREHTAVALFNRNASLLTDRKYQQTLSPEDYYPSPAVFVYTLANIVTGEIAIRHKIYGETSMYILDGPNPAVMNRIAACTPAPTLLCGWVDYSGHEDYRASLRLEF